MCVTESQISQIRDGIRARRASSVGSSTDSLLRECPRPEESYGRINVIGVFKVGSLVGIVTVEANEYHDSTSR